ncbi:MAG TPA: pyrroline-5-carboxylate reductase [Anaerovoracaceae bacterium]|nr:pyrroline-5-carboxylate reductase [Anaerovoracaceae bacterium]
MKFGFLGTGNMGGAIIRGYLAAHPEEKKNVFTYDADADKLKALADELGVAGCGSMEELALRSDAIILAIKPFIFDTVVPELTAFYRTGQVLVSIAAGISMGYIEKLAGKDGVKVVRVMPNTPAMVNAGMSALSRNRFIADEEFEPVLELFRSVGRAEVIPETLMDTVIGVSGSCPAYTYMFIEALVDAAEAGGMDREQAKTFAGQTVLGAAKMVLETGVDLVTLRKNVSSPGGTTIEAVNALQNNGFHDNIVEAFNAAVNKSKLITK